jgi:hypothetical protein
LLNNDLGGPAAAASAVIEKFSGELGSLKTALDDLAANFVEPDAQGPIAYAKQFLIEHPDYGSVTAKTDAIVAVEEFHGALNQHM